MASRNRVSSILNDSWDSQLYALYTYNNNNKQQKQQQIFKQSEQNERSATHL